VGWLLHLYIVRATGLCTVAAGAAFCRGHTASSSCCAVYHALVPAVAALSVMKHPFAPDVLQSLLLIVHHTYAQAGVFRQPPGG
jgi:hypothetical protein